MQSSKVHEILEEICQKVGGEWLLTGGSLVQLALEERRATEDIDIIGISHPELSRTLAQNELFKTAIKIGLSPENVNSAAGFFLHQIPHWKNHLIEIKKGPKGIVFRPDLMLFMVLKLGRATQIDVDDIAIAVKNWGNSEFSLTEFHSMASPEVIQRFEVHRKSWNL